MGKQRSSFVQNLAMMLDAGLPLIDAIKTIQDEVRSKPMRAVLQRILDLVEGGNPLWVSMEEQGLFSQYEVSLVRVGEEAGNLARNMELLSVQQEKDRNLRQKVKMAMIYPAIVMTLMFIVVMGLGIFVLPNLIQVLYALNVELPLSTRIVVAFTEFMQVYGMSTAGGMIAGAFVLLMLTKYTSFKVVTQWFIFHIPGIGSLAKEASIARFGVILGGLLQAGVPLVESMESLVNVTTMVSFRRFYQKVLDRIIVGDSFAISFHSIRGSRKVIPGSVQQLIITGEKSGALSDTCIKVAQIYERKAEETAEKLPVILEPTLLLMIGALVGFIAFSIIVPIYSAVGNVGGA
jgi:type IV pilus assembly protein PilC